MSIIPPTVYTLYQYINRLNGKRYIGVTNDPARRAKEHARGHDWSGSIFHVAIKKYSIEAFDYQVLAVTGQKRTPKTRAKMSDSAKARVARKKEGE